MLLLKLFYFRSAYLLLTRFSDYQVRFNLLERYVWALSVMSLPVLLLLEMEFLTIDFRHNPLRMEFIDFSMQFMKFLDIDIPCANFN